MIIRLTIMNFSLSQSRRVTLLLMILLFVVSYQFWGVVFQSRLNKRMFKPGLHQTVKKGAILYNGPQVSEGSNSSTPNNRRKDED